MSRDTRETKMHYSPSEKDGVFVVEVTRGADTAGGLSMCNNEHFQKKQGQLKMENSLNAFKVNNPDDINNHQEVQIHQPPDGISDDEILEVDENGAVSITSPRSSVLNTTRPNYGSSNTGLSQSDLSMTSSNGSNQAYCYGNQEPYTIDTKGYPTSPVAQALFCEAIPVSRTNSPIPIISDPNRPVITAAIFKQDTIDPANSFRDYGEPCRLMSDMLAEESHNEEKLLEEQRQLGNGEMPVILTEQITDKNNKHEIENNCDNIKENGETIIGPVDVAVVGFDSLAYLPDPPSIEEIKQLNDVASMDNNNMDSLPPPSPPEIILIIPTEEHNNGNIVES